MSEHMKTKGKVLGVSFSTINGDALSKTWVKSMQQFDEHSKEMQPELQRREAVSMEDAQRMIIG